MSKHWTRQEEKILMRMIADDDLDGAISTLGRTKFACWCHYRAMGYSMTSKGSGRMSKDEKIAFAKDIRAAMKVHRISQPFLSKEYGCNKVYMCSALSLTGRKSLTRGTADKIRDSLDRCILKVVSRNNMDMAAE